MKLDVEAHKNYGNDRRMQIKFWSEGEYLGDIWIMPDEWEVLRSILAHGTSAFVDGEAHVEIIEYETGEEVKYYG